MNRIRLPLIGLQLIASLCAWPGALQAQAKVSEPAPIRDLRIDPLLLVSVKEFRNIIKTIGSEIYPGWQANTVPLLLYRPLVQDVLLNAPHRPPGFARFTGHTALGNEVIYARNDSTAKDIDGQNTSMTLDSMRVLVVADQYSREREQIEGTRRQGPEVMEKWLKDWGFTQSPYDEVGTILHEAFHVHQDRLAPHKNANEASVAHYPLLDPTNNALVALEAMLLRDAILGSDPGQRRQRAEEFVAVRTLRRAKLDTASIAYENLNEFTEGTARYVQLRFMQLGERVTPVPEMYFHNGFTGYRGVLRKQLERRLDDLVNVAAFRDNRFGNRFGGGPMRFRLYDTGATQALILDEFAPTWKQRIFAPGVYLTDLLAAALPLSADRRAALAEKAKADFGYDSIFANRQAFEREGRRVIQQRVDAILKTSQTLVTINYGATGDLKGMGYTPFGVTAVNDHTAIYDLTPVAVGFANRVVLRMKSVTPVIVDRGAKTVTFAVASAPALFEGKGAAGVNIDELSLTGSPNTTISTSGNHVNIELH
jgi:hypothetical protein